ncbi:NAD(P)-dependent oxidoreductase [Kocuria marina]|uniref:Phosphoglycerate dehydrogenase n=1 Tax=Kocuria marina subsp. indica TaxID=1049583 RepID=A0A1X7CGA1_9MICC|nr:NAD(P)-dependent oxidoreductase [Kocuria indica]OXS84435.1 hydroxyacid dehydrogenase [Kocuria indica]RLP58799.1 hydroxyacid dehydrogenase [Kocuria indica]SME96036.1 Phosphoglycerate dehydrogenase [Kocuria indica]
MSHSQDVPLSDLRVISLPEQQLFDEISAETTDFTCVLWDLENEPEGCAREDVDIAVAPYYSGRWLKDPSVVRDVSLVQLQSTGFDGVPEKIGEDVALAAGGWVHAAGTAEIALGLIIAAQRNLDRAVLQQHEGVYKRYFSRAVADSRVTVVGVGEIGGAVISRLAPFEVELTRVASHAREDEAGRIHGIDELDEILPRTDILVLALPLGDATRDLVGERTLALLPDDALVVNVGRGPVVNTDALTAEVVSGRLRCALDVVDPEPLPGDHSLMSAAGSIVLPHVGGSNVSFRPRVHKLILEQLELIRQGRSPQFLVQPGRLALQDE